MTKVHRATLRERIGWFGFLKSDDDELDSAAQFIHPKILWRSATGEQHCVCEPQKPATGSWRLEWLKMNFDNVFPGNENTCLAASAS